MQEVTDYSNDFLRNIELIDGIDLELDKHGFVYVRDEHVDDLTDDTLFNSLLKTKRFRSIELRQQWVRLKISESNNTYYIIVYDRRKTNDNLEIIPEILELVSPVDNIIINHIKTIINPNKVLKDKEYIDLLKKIVVDNFSSLGAKENSIVESPIDGLTAIDAPLMAPFSLNLFFSKNKADTNNKHMAAIDITADNKNTYFSKLYYVEDISYLGTKIKEDIQSIRENLEEALNNNTMEELMVVTLTSRRSRRGKE